MKLNTFIVEDNPIIRENLVSTLEELAEIVAVGYSATEAQAVDWLERSRGTWHLTIVDLFLAHGNGLGVIAALSARDHTQKVIVLSNYATPEMRKRCLALGADAVFDKSSEIDALVEYCLSLSQSV